MKARRVFAFLAIGSYGAVQAFLIDGNFIGATVAFVAGVAALFMAGLPYRDGEHHD